jgi:hypothetical protein
MIKITNEVNGKKYELERYYGDSPCESCDLQEGCAENAQTAWCWRGVCDVLPGVWKEVRDAD